VATRLSAFTDAELDFSKKYGEPPKTPLISTINGDGQYGVFHPRKIQPVANATACAGRLSINDRRTIFVRRAAVS
jgi:hypothetical protein